MDITGTGSSSPQFMVESPPERLSPSNQRAFRGDDLSPVSDQPAHDKRKIAINIGASPSGFILEEDEEQEEENDEELEVVDARMFRPIVEPPQSSADQGEDYDTEEVPAAELVDDQPGGDAAGKGTVLAVDVDVGLCDGPGEVSDEGATPPEDFKQVEKNDMSKVLETEPVEEEKKKSRKNVVKKRV